MSGTRLCRSTRKFTERIELIGGFIVRAVEPDRYHRSVSTIDTDSPAGIVAVFVDGDRFLLIRRAEGIPSGGWWTPPSGGIEPGETPQQAVVREMREELGLSVEQIAHVWTCPSYDGKWQLYWWLCRTVDAITPEPAEVAEVRWCTLAEMRQLSPTFPDDLRFFTDVLPGIDLDTGAQLEQES